MEGDETRKKRLALPALKSNNLALDIFSFLSLMKS
jgi:hypothetical protein